MRKKLLLLNAVLLGFLVLGASELYRAYIEAQQRYALLEQFADSRQAPDYPPPADPQPVRQAEYMPIVDHLLFYADRNPIVVVETPEPKKVERPALPVLSGLVDFGDGLSALMSPGGETRPEWIKVGDKVGDYVFNGLDGEKVKLAWNEEEIVVAQDQLKKSETKEKASPRSRSAQAGRGGNGGKPAAPAVAAAATNVTGANEDARIGPEIAPGRNRVAKGDNSPDGTVYKGFVKRVRQTPFGSQAWWEKQAEKEK